MVDAVRNADRQTFTGKRNCRPSDLTGPSPARLKRSTRCMHLDCPELVPLPLKRSGLSGSLCGIGLSDSEDRDDDDTVDFRWPLRISSLSSWSSVTSGDLAVSTSSSTDTLDSAHTILPCAIIDRDDASSRAALEDEMRQRDGDACRRVHCRAESCGNLR